MDGGVYEEQVLVRSEPLGRWMIAPLTGALLLVSVFLPWADQSSRFWANAAVGGLTAASLAMATSRWSARGHHLIARTTFATVTFDAGSVATVDERRGLAVVDRTGRSYYLTGPYRAFGARLARRRSRGEADVLRRWPAEQPNEPGAAAVRRIRDEAVLGIACGVVLAPMASFVVWLLLY